MSILRDLGKKSKYIDRKLHEPLTKIDPLQKKKEEYKAENPIIPEHDPPEPRKPFVRGKGTVGKRTTTTYDPFVRREAQNQPDPYNRRGA